MNPEDFITTSVLNVSFSNVGFLVFLKKEGENKALPICIGAAEVNSISAALSEQSFPHPLSHDLFKNIMDVLEYDLPKVYVTELRDGTFYARVFLSKDQKEYEFDARPSDAIALALRYQAPIYVHKDVFEEAGVPLTEEEKKEKVETKRTPLEELRNALSKAVSEERYEDAGRIQKKIEDLEMDDLMNN